MEKKQQDLRGNRNNQSEELKFETEAKGENYFYVRVTKTKKKKELIIHSSPWLMLIIVLSVIIVKVFDAFF